MKEGRPGGLTALAIINFVFAGFYALGSLGMLAIFLMYTNDPEKVGATLPPEVLGLLENMGLFMLTMVLTILVVVLLIMSGVGYLGQKKRLGRVMGSAYGVAALVNSGVVFLLPGDQFGIDTMIEMVYPVLTLILINTTFKEDLVN